MVIRLYSPVVFTNAGSPSAMRICAMKRNPRDYLKGLVYSEKGVAGADTA